MIDWSICNVVSPQVQKALNLSQADRQWMLTAVTFAMGAALLLGGRAVDYFGAKRTFVAWGPSGSQSPQLQQA